MTPYYSDDLVTLYHGDCIQNTALWLEGDVLVTDPPYGVAYVSNASRYGSTKPIESDHDTSIRDRVLELWGPRPALVFGSWRATRPEGVRQLLIWDKGDSPGMGDLSMPWGPGHEEVYVFGEGWSGRRRPNVHRVPTLPAQAGYRPEHPTPKPVALMEELVAYAPPGVVVDPFSGSGSTLVAARNQGRRAIGVEIEERYCEVAARRLAQDALPFD